MANINDKSTALDVATVGKKIGYRYAYISYDQLDQVNKRGRTDLFPNEQVARISLGSTANIVKVKIEVIYED